MPARAVPETPTTYPTHRLLGALDTDAAADALLSELEALGLADDVWVLDAQGARSTLDSAGNRQGLLHTLTRLVQSIGYEAGQLAQYEAIADTGAWIVAPDLSDALDRKDDVVTAFERCGAHTIRYFGPLSIENLGDTPSAS